MSSKEQYKDALKRAKARIKELEEELGIANLKNVNLHGMIDDLQAIIRSSQPNIKLKRWWQFWK